MKNLKIIVILVFLFLAYIFVSAYSYVSAISDNLYNSVFRLHVIANSDSKEDQDLKYIVRDNLINYMNENSSEFSNKEEVVQYSKHHIKDFEKIALDTIKSLGFDYPVQVEVGNFDFPTKNYGDVSFPAGYYDALRVKIGSASGKNWWCVMFPPLCFVDTTTGIIPASSKESLHEELSDENYKIVSDARNVNYSFKFKIVEFFENSGLITAKK